MRFDYTLLWDENGAHRPVTARIDLEGVSPTDYLVQFLHNNRTFYERGLLEFLAQRGPRGGIFVDVGANIGNHSVYFGKFLADYVICCEPSPTLLPILSRNLQANGINNHLLFSCAVGAKEGVGRVFVPSGREGNLGETRVQDIDGLPNERTGPDVVLVRTLDAIVDEARTRWPKAAVTFVKIDVEGMEIDVLRGAAQLLSEARPQLSVELASHSAFEEAGSFLAELGYKHVGRFCATPTYHFINPSVHRLRKLPPRILRSWYDGRLRKLRDVLGMKSS